MSKLLLIRGLPGSGKSTIAKDYVLQGYQNYEADMYHIGLNGEYNWNPANLKKAHKWCKDQTEKELASGNNVVVSNTFTTQKEIQPYRELATKYDAKLEIIVATGDYDNVHNVPLQTVQKMRNRWED